MQLLRTNYSNFVRRAMNYLAFTNLFFFFLWKTRQPGESQGQQESVGKTNG
jgi:hypothetical protein